LKSAGADDRNVGQDRNSKRLERFDLGRRGHFRQDEAVGEIGQTGRQKRDADAHDVLRQAERHGERAMQEAEHRAGQRCDRNARPEVAAGIDCHPARERADRHDALDAEVQHASALADQFAHGGEDQGRGDADRCDPERRGKQDFEGFDHHRHLTLNRVSMIATTMVSSDVATMTLAM
jgi:hypothetical protein